MKKLGAIIESILYLAVFIIIPILCSCIFAVVFWILPINQLNETILINLVEIFSYIIIFIVLYFATKKRRFFNNDIKLKMISPHAIILLVLLGLSMFYTFSFILDNINFWENWFDIEETSLDMAGPKGFVEIILSFIATCIATPIIEELIFRGYIYSTLKNNFPKVAACIIVSIFFGVLHIPNDFATAISSFLGSFLLIWVFDRYNSLCASILVHSFFNCSAVLVELVNVDSYETIIVIVSIAVFIASLIGIYFDTKKPKPLNKKIEL